MKAAYKVKDLVPHSGVMSLLDEVVSYGDSSLCARVTISPESLFATERGVPGWVGIEYMAQAIAAYAGVLSREAGEDLSIGFLVGTRRYTCNNPCFPIGTVLLVSVCKVLQGDNGLGVFDCELVGEGVKAEACLNVFQPEDIDDFLKNDDSNSISEL